MSRQFMPTARQVNWLLVVGFLSVGYAFYLRYLVIEQSTVGLACQGGFNKDGLNTWLCLTRRVVIALFSNSVFGGVALAVALLNFLRPSLVLFTLALTAAGFGIVLYNVGLSALAVGILILSFARPLPETE